MVVLVRLAILAATSTVAVALAGGVFAPPAGAVPGQCVTAPFSSFCAEPIPRNGTSPPCESLGWGPFYSSNCYQVCARTGAQLPVAMDANYYDTPC